MTVGSLVLSSGSITSIDIDATAASSIDATVSATIDGALQIVPEIAPYNHQGSYLIVAGNNINGSFSSINTSPGFTFGLTYLPNEIYLNYSLGIPTEDLTGNSLKLANYLNANAIPSNEFTRLAFLSGSSLQNALASVSPARNGFATYIAAQTAFSLSNVISSHLDTSRLIDDGFSKKNLADTFTADSSDQISKKSPSCKNKFSTWITGFGEFAHQSASLQNPSFSFGSEAILAGFDFHIKKKNLVGSS